MPDPTEQMADWKTKTDAATEGPWQYEHGYESWVRADAARGRNNESGLVCEGAWEGDAAFIAMSRSAFPKLLSAVESVLALHVPETRAAFGADGYEEGEYEACTGCWDAWPCPTVRAINDALEGGE